MVNTGAHPGAGVGEAAPNGRRFHARDRIYGLTVHENELDKPPKTWAREAYTRAEYDRVKAQLSLRPGTEEALKGVQSTFAVTVRILARLLAHAYEDNSFSLCAYEVAEVLKRLVQRGVSS